MGLFVGPWNQGVYILISPWNWAELFLYSFNLEMKLMKNLGESCHVLPLQTSNSQCGPHREIITKDTCLIKVRASLGMGTTFLNIVMCIVTLANSIFVIWMCIDTWRACVLGSVNLSCIGTLSTSSKPRLICWATHSIMGQSFHEDTKEFKSSTLSLSVEDLHLSLEGDNYTDLSYECVFPIGVHIAINLDWELSFSCQVHCVSCITILNEDVIFYQEKPVMFHNVRTTYWTFMSENKNCITTNSNTH